MGGCGMGFGPVAKQAGDAKAIAIAGMITRNKKTSNLGLAVFLNERI